MYKNIFSHFLLLLRPKTEKLDFFMLMRGTKMLKKNAKNKILCLKSDTKKLNIFGIDLNTYGLK